MNVFWTKEALIQIRKIGEYIANDNPGAAVKLINKIVELGESLTSLPLKGRVVPEFSTPEIRELFYKNYRIVYLCKKTKIEILTVFEGHKLINKEIKTRQ